MPTHKRFPRPRRKRHSTTLRQVVREVREMKQAEERKFLDASVASAAMTLIPLAAAVPPVVINNIPQGNGVGERNGNKVELTSLQIDAWVAPLSCLNPTDQPGLTCAPLASLVRFIAVWFPGISSATAAQISLDNVLEDPRNIQSFYKRDGKVNYKRLVDRMHKIEYGFIEGGSGGGQWAPLSSSDFRLRKTIPLKKQATYDGATLTPTKGVVCYYIITDNIGAPFTTPTSVCHSAINTRLTWTDD